MTDMIVSGAGSSVVNGTYVESGTTNGKPYYKFGSYYLQYKTGFLPTDPPTGGNGWELNGYYIAANDVATPDLCTSWEVGLLSGTLPVPTVTAASSGTTHEGESSISSLSYLRTKKA